MHLMRQIDQFEINEILFKSSENEPKLKIIIIKMRQTKPIYRHFLISLLLTWKTTLVVIFQIDKGSEYWPNSKMDGDAPT